MSSFDYTHCYCSAVLLLWILRVLMLLMWSNVLRMFSILSSSLQSKESVWTKQMKTSTQSSAQEPCQYLGRRRLLKRRFLMWVQKYSYFVNYLLLYFCRSLTYSDQIILLVQIYSWNDHRSRNLALGVYLSSAKGGGVCTAPAVRAIPRVIPRTATACRRGSKVHWSHTRSWCRSRSPLPTHWRSRRWAW